jgi:DNA-binding LacI/PurR family transcriptional regulator
MDKLIRKPGAPVTSWQVAALAGVSQSAVSRSFTPGASISAATRAKVMDAARELGYRPNAIARSLITSRSRIIGVVMAYLENLFYPNVLEELGRRLAALNYHLLLFTGFKDRDSDPVFDRIMQYRVDGIILASTGLSSALSGECAAAGIPVVLFNRTTEGDGVSSVTSRNLEGGRRIADFLVAGGHRRFAYIAGLANSSTNRDRQAGFVAGLAAHGAPPAAIRFGHYSIQAAAAATRELMALDERPDAIFAANDHMAIAVIDTLRHEFGVQVPADISVVGYDDVGPARWPAYAITTVAQPLEQMVAETVDLVMAQIESGRIFAEHRVVAGDLIVRHSARRPASGIVERDGRSIYCGDGDDRR